MSIDLFMNDTCLKCRKPVRQTTIKRHPTRRDLAIHNFECVNCGAVKTKILSLKLGLPPEQKAGGTPPGTHDIEPCDGASGRTQGEGVALNILQFKQRTH
jgi:hypothetical protein